MHRRGASLFKIKETGPNWKDLNMVQLLMVSLDRYSLPCIISKCSQSRGDEYKAGIFNFSIHSYCFSSSGVVIRW
jgi:hypothetical protein